MMGLISISRYDPKRIYLLFILSFSMYFFFNVSSWKLHDSLGDAQCLRDNVITSAARLNLTPSENYLIVVTPTYRRLTQLPDAVRLKQALLLVPNVVWIVIEDSECRHEDVYSYIRDFPRLIYVNRKLRAASSQASSPRGPTGFNKGAEQRNLAIHLLGGEQLKGVLGAGSVVYFADDDNTYNSQLLPRLLNTKQLSVFNVGLINEDIEGPITDQNGVFVGWRTRYLGRFFSKERKFCIDMAGFAVSLSRLLHTKALFDSTGTRGYLESDFLELLGVGLEQLEVLTANQSEIVAWHTKTSYMATSFRLLSYLHRLLRVCFMFVISYLAFCFLFYRLRPMVTNII